MKQYAPDKTPLPYPVDPRILPQQGTDLRWILRKEPAPDEEPLPWTAGGLYIRNVGTRPGQKPTAASRQGPPLHYGKELDAIRVNGHIAVTLSDANCMNRNMGKVLATIRTSLQLLLTCQDQWLRYTLRVDKHKSIFGMRAIGAVVAGRAKSPMAALEDYCGAGVTITEINGTPTGCRP